MYDFRFDAASHTYTLNGRVLPSVTQILKPIGPDYSTVPADVLEAKRALGVAVHKACELDDEDDLDELSLSEVLQPYVASWRKFRADTGAIVLENERQLFRADLSFAGTVDRLATLQGDFWLLDLKTAADPHASYGVQLAGYELLLQGGRGPLRRGTVHLRDDGTYRLHEFKNPNDAACFRALLSLHQWKESNK